jgi:hypothetical protein
VLEEGKRFFFVENPVLPFAAAVAHGSEDHFGDL